jgi:hypothetical protein
MTSTTRTASTSIDRPVAPFALATFLGTAAFTALGIYGDGSEGSPGSLGELLTILALTAVAVAVVFGLVVPRNQQSSRAATVGLVLSAVGLLLVVAFWSGLTPALAVGGIVLGAAARRSNLRPTTGSIAMAVGALALVGYVAIYVTDWMATNNIAGM